MSVSAPRGARQRWLSANDFADITEITTRQLRRLHAQGLPHRHRGQRLEYPLADGVQWILAYRRQLQSPDDAGTAEWISMWRARAEYYRVTVLDCEARERRLGTFVRDRPQYDDDGRRLLSEDEVAMWGAPPPAPAESDKPRARRRT